MWTYLMPWVIAPLMPVVAILAVVSVAKRSTYVIAWGWIVLGLSLLGVAVAVYLLPVCCGALGSRNAADPGVLVAAASSICLYVLPGVGLLGRRAVGWWAALSACVLTLLPQFALVPSLLKGRDFGEVSIGLVLWCGAAYCLVAVALLVNRPSTWAARSTGRKAERGSAHN